ncbi:Cof-type HAD-IIB family hydrolase [Tepidibacillus marianensis]|uniref:Cof-type HAD-IIB family hydrolase n=1 Tax=Tepidibacillus marianensis TaxID=3131995 RepID=UPI0030CD90EA
MNYKLLALDIDGTLFSSEHYILPLTKKIIKNAINDGLHVTLATGRSFSFAKKIANDLSIKVPIVTHDGALIGNSIKNSLYTERLSNEVVQEIVEILLEYQLKIELQNDPQSILNFKFPWMNFIKMSPYAYKYKMVEFMISKYISSEKLLGYIQSSKVAPNKISIVGQSEKKIKLVKQVLATRFQDHIRMTSSGIGIEILPKKISKAHGLKVLSESLGILPEEIIAIGDNHNDLEMIRFAGLGVAMANAPLEVREQANFVTHSNDENGIAYVIQKFYY